MGLSKIRILVVGVVILLGMTVLAPGLWAIVWEAKEIPTPWTGAPPGAPELKVIKIWDKTNVDQIKDLLTDGYYYRIKNWGLKLKEVEHIPWVLSEKRLEFTEKSKCSLGPRGDLLNYVSGVPFPDPKSGIEEFWNQYVAKNNLGDNVMMDATPWSMVDRTGRVRFSIYRRRDIVYQGRCEIFPPILNPEKENPEGILEKIVCLVYHPPEARGLTTLIVRYWTGEENNMWAYIPSLRRVRRMSAAQGQDGIFGSDLTFDDLDGHHPPKFYEFEYRLLGKKEMLLSYHQTELLKQSKEVPYQWQDITVERMPVYVLEIIPKDPSYMYGKKILYLDAVTHWFGTEDMWNRKGSFCKTTTYNNDMFPTTIGKVYGYGRWSNCEVTDYLAHHATFFSRGFFLTNHPSVIYSDFELSQLREYAH
jgi:hypothetical protein